MRKKLVGIFVMTLMIAATALPVAVSMNENKIYTKEISIPLQPTIEWEKSFAGPEFDQLRDVKQTDDGGYIAFGEYEEETMTYARLIKVDSEGNEEWTNIHHDLNGSGYDDGELMNSLLITSDGGYLACGYYTYHYQGEYQGEDFDFWGPAGFLWKTDSDGNTEWINEIYDIDALTYMAPFHILELDDGYIGTGYFGTYLDLEMTEYNFNVGLFKTDFEGELLWYKTYDFGGYEGGQSITQTTDSGYYITGSTQDNDNVDGVAMIMVKTDASGNKQWDKIFDTPEDDWSYVRETCCANDGGFIICGATGDLIHESNLIIIKTDSSGNKEWEKRYGSDSLDYLWGMDRTSDGGYVFALVTDYGKFFGNRDDSWIIKTDADGNAEWKLRIEQEGRQVPISIDQTSDEGFIFSYRTGYADTTSTHSYLVKLSAFENQRPEKPQIDGPSKGKPDKEYAFIASSSDPDGDSLTYMWDWGDGNYSEWLEDNEATHTWTNGSSFEIRVKVKDEHGGESEWSEPLGFTPRSKAIGYDNNILWNILEKFPLIKSLF